MDQSSFTKKRLGETKSRSLDSKPEQTLKLRELLEELESVKEWRTLLFKLGLENYQIEEIDDDDDNYSDDDKKRKGFDKWLHAKHDACWNDVIKVLFDMGEGTLELASTLEKKYAWTDSREKSVMEDHRSGDLTFLRSRSLDSKSERTLRLGEMLEELRSINEWKTLLLKLGMEDHVIRKIASNHQKVRDKKHEGLDLWLRNKCNACWNDIIKALFEMGEGTLARMLAKKYCWKDPRTSVDTVSLVNAPGHVPITAIPVPSDLPHQKLLPSLQRNQEYFTLQADTSFRISAESTKYFARWMKEKPREGHTLLDFLKSIEESEDKSDFKIGLKARFGKMYWKLKPEDVLPVRSPRENWSQSKILRKSAFHPEISESDVEQFFMDKERLGRKVYTSIILKFTVEGQGEGDYTAVIASYDEDEFFYLDSVYRQTVREKRARINIALPGSKYDVRIADCSECIVLEQDESTPHKIASTIVKSLCRLHTGKLSLILHGKIEFSRHALSIWKVNYIRQRKQIQYKWRPDKRWIVARYDINEFDHKTNESVNVDSAPINEVLDIPKFNCTRSEVELLGQQVFPKDVNETRPSKEKYFYIEGIAGVKLPGGEFRPPYNWTAADLMKDFEDFLGDVFKIANNLGGINSL